MSEISLRKRIALDINRSLVKDLRQKHQLRQLFWESTLRCNLKCRHCGSDCKAVAQTPDMPLADFVKVLEGVRQKTDPSKVLIIVSGGEPLMRKDLVECGRTFFEMGFPWGMVTNGFAMTREKFRELLWAGLRSMTVSLDGLEEDHDWMRGREHSFTRAVEAIRTAIEFNNACASGSAFMDVKQLKPQDRIGFDVVTCVNRRNVGKLQEIKNFLIGLGLKEWRLFTVFPAGRGKSPEMQLTSSELRSLMEFIKSTRKEGIIKASFGCEGFLGEYEGEVRDHFFFCNAGIGVGNVMIDGAISACGSIRADYHQGNIYQDDFMDVWENRFQAYRNREWMHKDECADCKWWKHCEGNGMHLRDDEGRLIQCLYRNLQGKDE